MFGPLRLALRENFAVPKGALETHRSRKKTI
jgi:hypothetical protein